MHHQQHHKMKKQLSIIVATLLVGFAAGWIIKPQPPVLTDKTVTLAKAYCDRTLKTLPPSKERSAMVDALNNLNKGNISLSDEIIPGSLNYRMVQLFASAQELNQTMELLPKPSPTTAEVSSL